MQKIHENFGDRATQRVGMLFWWSTFLAGFGFLLTRLF